MIWEIFALGNGELLWELFNGVKMLMADPWVGALRLAALLGLLAALALIATKPSGASSLTLLAPLLTILIVALLTTSITVNVAITDVLDPTANQQVLTNVPLGVALPWWISSQLGYEVTSAVSTVLSAPQKPTIFEGFMKHQIELQALLTAQLPSGGARQTLLSYLSECVFPNMIGDGHLLSPEELQTSPNLLGAIGHGMDDTVRMTNMYVDGNIAESRTCQGAYSGSPSGSVLPIPAIFGADSAGADGAHPDYKRTLHELMQVAGVSSVTALEDELALMFDGLMGMTPDRFDSNYSQGVAGARTPLNTVLLQDLWHDAVALVLEADQNVAGITRKMITQLQRELQYQVESSSWSLGYFVPMMRSLAEAVVLVMTPLGLLILLANARLFGVGAFVKMFIWLMLWWPLLAILDNIMYFYAARQLRMEVLCPAGAPETLAAWIAQTASNLGSLPQCQGITMRNYDQIKSLVMAINSVGMNLLGGIPFFAATIVYAGGNLASAIVESIGKAQPDTAGAAKTAGEGKLRPVLYEGPDQLITWSQETGFTTAANYRTGVQSTRLADGRTLYTGSEGTYTTDRAGHVIDGKRTRQHADGTTTVTEGFGNLMRETTVGKDGSRVVKTFDTTGGQPRLVSTEEFLAANAEGLKEEKRLNADGQGTILQEGVKDGHYITRQLNERGVGTQTETGTFTVPIVQPDGSVQNMLMQGTVYSRYENGQATNTHAAFKAVTDRGEYAIAAKWDADKNAWRVVSGQIGQAITDRRVGTDPVTGKLALVETTMSPDGQMAQQVFRQGAEGSIADFHETVGDVHLRGKVQAFVADDGSQRLLFEGTGEKNGQTYHTTGFILTDVHGHRTFIERNDASGLTGQEKSFSGVVDGWRVEGSKSWSNVNGKILPVYTGVFTNPKTNESFTGSMYSVMDRHGNEHLVRMEAKSGTNLAAEDVKTTRHYRLFEGIKEVKNPSDPNGKPILAHAVEWYDPKTDELISATYANAKTGSFVSVWTDKDNATHSGIGEFFQDKKTGEWRVKQFQETGEVKIDRNGYGSTIILNSKTQKPLFEVAKQGQQVEIQDSFLYDLRKRAEVNFMSGARWVPGLDFPENMTQLNKESGYVQTMVAGAGAKYAFDTGFEIVKDVKGAKQAWDWTAGKIKRFFGKGGGEPGISPMKPPPVPPDRTARLGSRPELAGGPYEPKPAIKQPEKP